MSEMSKNLFDLLLIQAKGSSIFFKHHIMMLITSSSSSKTHQIIHFVQQYPNQLFFANIINQFYIYSDFALSMLFVFILQQYLMDSGKFKQVGCYHIFLNRQLGHGASGTVYEGVNMQTKEIVAIKMVPRKVQNNSSLSEAHMIRSLTQEATILNRINSEYVVGFRGIFMSKRFYYIAQEKCDTNLRSYLRKRIQNNDPLSQKQAIDFMVQILHGYYALLLMSYIHRDIKPENILMKDGKLKLADFGFAKRIAQKKMLQTKAGTEGYLAPEIQNGAQYTSKCDVYSLGCVFFELLYSRMLFKGYKSKQKIMKRMEQINQFDDWFPIDRQVSKACKDVIKKCLKMKQSERINWADLYSHQVFANKVPNLKNLQNYLQHLINVIRRQIQNSNTTTIKYLLSKGLRRQKQIDFLEFTKFLMKVVPPDSPFTAELLKYSFQNFDQNKSGKVSFDQFVQVLTKSRPKISGKQLKFQMLTQVITRQFGQEVKDEQCMTQAQLQQRNRADEAYSKLIKQIIQNKIQDINSEYSIQDLDESGIDKQTFRTFIQINLNLKMNDEQCDLVFMKMDDDNNQKIDVNQFTKYVSKELTQETLNSHTF